VSEILVNAGKFHWMTALIVHVQSAYFVLVKGLGLESGSVGGLESALSGFFLFLLLLLFKAHFDLLEVKLLVNLVPLAYLGHIVSLLLTLAITIYHQKY